MLWRCEACNAVLPTPVKGVPVPRTCPKCRKPLGTPPEAPAGLPLAQRPGPEGEAARQRVHLIQKCRTCFTRYDAKLEACPRCEPPTVAVRMAQAQAAVVSRRTCRGCGKGYAAELAQCPTCRVPAGGVERVMRQVGDDGWQLERAAMNSGALGGLAMTVVGIVWLLVGLQQGWIFYYPIVLILGGLYLTLDGLLDSGPRRRRRRRRAPRFAEQAPKGGTERGRDA